MPSISETLVLEKLDSLQNCLRRIREKVPVTVQELETDVDAQDILSINLERSVQLCADIAGHIIASQECKAPLTMADGFIVLARLAIISELIAKRMQKAVGMRNLLVHQYKKVDWSIVHRVATTDIQTVADFGNEISTRLSQLLSER